MTFSNLSGRLGTAIMNSLALLIVPIMTNLLIVAVVVALPYLAHRRRKRRLQQAGIARRAAWTFSYDWFGEPRQRRLAGSLDDEALVWARFLPDHTKQAKRFISQELQRRGTTPELLDRWKPSPRDLTVPPALDARISVRRYQFWMRMKALTFRLFRIVIWILLVILVVMNIIEAIFGRTAERSLDKLTAHFKSREIAQFYLVMDQYAIYALLAALVLIPVVSAILLRKRAIRVLLLRPFGEKRMTTALRRVVVRNLGLYGHVYTLSDRNYRPNMIVAALMLIPFDAIRLLVMYLLSPLLRNSLRIATVASERQYSTLQRFLLRLYRPSHFSFLGGGQAFNIRTSDEWWQLCITMLMHSCEIIVIDLSKVKEGTAWELAQIKARGLQDKCIHIITAEQDPGETLARFFSAQERPAVFSYTAVGAMTDARAFTGRCDQLLADGLARAMPVSTGG